MNKSEIKERKEAGRRAAELASNSGEVAIDEKPFGQTSEDVYPYTYWYVVGWNEYVKEST